MTSVPVMSDGIRSGVNWMRLKRQVEGLGQRADHERLGQPGHAHEQGVAAAEDRHEQLVEHLLLADDDLADLLPQLLVGGAELLDHRDVVLDGGGLRHGVARSNRDGEGSGWGGLEQRYGNRTAGRSKRVG